jgi:phospholipase/carboxylesterase
MLLMLHGVGSHERDLFDLAEYLDRRFFIVSARAPNVLGPDAYAWYPVEFTATGPIIDPEAAEDSRLIVLRFIDELIGTYHVDPKRVFLMGFSQGAIMSLSIMLTHPEKIAGVVAMSGRLLDEVKPEMVAPEKLEGFPVLMAHGVSDEVIPIRYARQAMEYLRTLKVDLFYREYGMGHTISEASLTDILEWLNGVVPG